MGKSICFLMERRPKMYWVYVGFVLCTLVTFSQSAPGPKGFCVQQNSYQSLPAICRACCGAYYDSFIYYMGADFHGGPKSCPIRHDKRFCFFLLLLMLHTKHTMPGKNFKFGLYLKYQ